MIELGGRLRRARKQIGLSVQDISNRTHIHTDYLEALESDRLDSLPSDVYTRGFIRSYAAAVDLNPDPLIEAFDSVRHPLPAVLPSVPHRRYQPRKVSMTALDLSDSYAASSRTNRSHRNRSRTRISRNRHSTSRTWGFAALVFVLIALGLATAQHYGIILPHVGQHAAEDGSNSSGILFPTKATIRLGLRATGHVLWRVTTDAGVHRQSEGEAFPGERMSFIGSEQIKLYANRGNNLRATLNGRSLGRLTSHRAPIWLVFTPDGITSDAPTTDNKTERTTDRAMPITDNANFTTPNVMGHSISYKINSSAIAEATHSSNHATDTSMPPPPGTATIRKVALSLRLLNSVQSRGGLSATSRK